VSAGMRELPGGIAWLPEPRAVLGEGPVWDERGQRLHWVDADRRRLFTWRPASGETQVLELTHAPGSYALRADGRLILASRNELALFDPATGAREVIPTPELDFSMERFNDGACDRAGRFWVGTMDKRMTEPVGSLYRVDPDLVIRRVARGFAISNGIAFSPDDRRMYHTESRSRRVFVHDYDIATGALENGRVFVELGADQGNPDGCTVDADGCLWIAQIGAGCVGRFDPEGRPMVRIGLPTQRPTSVAFGGDELDTLFITTMQHDLTPQQLAGQPQAGCLLALRPGVRGLPEPRFGA